MRFAILGSGAVGGYFGAKLAKAGQDVTFIARGPHLDAIRSKGLEVKSAKLGDFTVKAAAESDTALVGPVDVAIVSVKAYDNATALPMRRPLIGSDTVVLTRQNGVDSTDEVSAIAGEHRVLGGTTYVATALEAPTTDEIEALVARLGRLDGKKPWTRETMQLIRKHPRIAASKLAAKLGRETLPFKVDVRKLKKLGLTQSFEVGYELSPRGAAVLAAQSKKARRPEVRRRR